MENIIFTKTSDSEEDTKHIAFDFAKDLNGGTIVLLFGEIGSGKTAFVKGIAKQKNIKEEVTSPTFTIINEYSGRNDIYHMDLYRINKFEELFEVGFEEYLYTDGIVIIEWPEIAMPLLKKSNYKIIEINKVSDKMRKIIYKTVSHCGE